MLSRRSRALLVIAMVASLLGVTNPSTATAAASATTYTALPFETFTDAPLPSAAATTTRRVFLSSSSYRSYFGRYAPANVDWTREWVYLYSAGDKPTNGYSASVTEVRRYSDYSLGFSDVLQAPGANCTAQQGVTRPYVLVAFPKSSVAPPSASHSHLDTVRDCAAQTTKTFTYTFATDAQGWTAGFADYSPQTSDMRLEARIAPLPAGTATGNGYFLQGMNRSDDLFMLLKRRVGPTDGIVAGKRYAVRTSVTFWTNSSADCFGIGGSPGGSVYLKGGAANREPLPVLDSLNHYRMNIDKGEQAAGGANATVHGTIDNGLTCGDGRWVRVTKTSATPVEVQADANGQLWLLAGTDSGYEGLTQLYYSGITATLTAL